MAALRACSLRDAAMATNLWTRWEPSRCGQPFSPGPPPRRGDTVVVRRQPTPPENGHFTTCTRHNGYFGDDDRRLLSARSRLALTLIAAGATIFAAIASAGS